MTSPGKSGQGKARGGVVLAGGRSTRMGRDKAGLEFGGEPLLARVLRALAAVCDEVVVVARHEQTLPTLPLLPSRVQLKLAYDEVEGRGPLAGLEAGLAALEAEVAYVSSCDVPFLVPAFVTTVVSALGDAHVAMPLVDGRHHPLAAAYRRSEVLPVVRALLAEDRLRPVFLLERLPHVELGEDTLRQVDPALVSLLNCNTPEELERALALRASRRVTVELFGIAVERAALHEVGVEGSTLREALADLERRVPALSGEVVVDGALGEHWVASLDGRRFTADGDAPLEPGARVLLLSSLAGG